MDFLNSVLNFVITNNDTKKFKLNTKAVLCLFTIIRSTTLNINKIKKNTVKGLTKKENISN